MISEIGLIESSTDRLFLGATLINKEPYMCPECGKVCYYMAKPILPELFMYRRNLCDCEKDLLAEEERRRESDRITRLSEAYRRNCGLEGKLAEMRLENLEPVEGLGQALRAARRFVNEWPNCLKGLILSGPFGCGKTHIAAGIGNALLDKVVRVEFHPGFGLLQEIRKSYDTPGIDVCERFSRVELLIIDDLGSERIASDERGDWAREQLFKIFYHREIDALKTIVTTNLNVDELMDKIGGASVSRLLGMCDWHSIMALDFRVTG